MSYNYYIAATGAAMSNVFSCFLHLSSIESISFITIQMSSA